MKRILWFGIGIATTVVVAGYVAKTHEKVKAAAQLTSPEGLGEKIGELAVAVRETAREFRQSITEHEATLTATLLGERQPNRPQLDGSSDDDHWPDSTPSISNT